MAYKPGGGGHIGSIQGKSLQINVVGCRHLSDKEWFSRQDPYVIIEYGNNRFRTRTDTDGGKNPSFNEKFTIPLIEGLREFNISVYNSNTVSLDDYIGGARVLMDKVLSTSYDDTAWPLKSKHGKSAGEVNLIMHYANAASGIGGSAGYLPPAHGAPAGYPPSAYPPSAPAGYPPPAHGAPAGYPPPAHGAPAGYPPAHGAPSSYAAAPGPGYPPAQSYSGGPSGYPPSAYPPPQSSHAAPGYPPAYGHSPSGHAPYPAPAGYPAAAPPVYGVPPGMHKAGKVHVGSSGHYKHGKHKKHKGHGFFGKKYKGWKGKGWKVKGWKGKK